MNGLAVARVGPLTLLVYLVTGVEDPPRNRRLARAEAGVAGAGNCYRILGDCTGLAGDDQL